MDVEMWACRKAATPIMNALFPVSLLFSLLFFCRKLNAGHN